MSVASLGSGTLGDGIGRGIDARVALLTTLWAWLRLDGTGPICPHRAIVHTFSFGPLLFVVLGGDLACYFVFAPTFGLPVPGPVKIWPSAPTGEGSEDTCSGYRTPAGRGRAVRGDAIKLPDGRQKVSQHHSCSAQGPAKEDLPVAVDIEDSAAAALQGGGAAEEFWNWQAPDVVIVNLSDDTIVCRVGGVA